MRDDPIVISPAQWVTSTKLVRRLLHYLDQAQEKPIFISRERGIEAVLLSLEEYRRLLEGGG